MAEKEEIVFQLVVGKDDLNSALTKAKNTTKNVESDLSGIPKLFAGLDKSISGIFSGFGASILASVGSILAIKEAIQSAAEEEKSISKLNFQLEALGLFSQEASDSILEFADSLEKSTGISSELATDLVTLSVTMGASLDQAKRIVSIAPSFAAAFGGSADDGVIKLTKSLSGFDGGLGKVIPELKKFTKEQFEAGDAITFLEGKFKNLAENQFATTFQGRFDFLKVALGDFLKAVGRIIIESPQIIQLLNDTARAIVYITEALPDAISGFKSFLNGIESVRASLIDTFAKVGKVQVLVVENLAKLPGYIFGVNDSIEANARALDAALDIVKSAAISNNNYREEIVQTGIALTELNTFLQDNNNVLQNNGKTLSDFVRTNKAASEATYIFDQSVKAIRNSLSQLDTNKLQSLRDSLEKVNIDTLSAIRKIHTENLALLDRALKSGAATEKEINELRLKELEDFRDKEKKILDKRKADSKELAEAIKKQFTPTEGFTIFDFDKISDGLTRVTKDFKKGLIEAEDRNRLVKDFQTAGVDLVKTAGKFGGALVGGASNMLKTISTGIGPAFGPLGPIFAEIANQVIDLFGQAPEEFQRKMLETVTGIGKILSNVMTNAAELFSGKSVSGIVTGLIDSIPQITQALAYSVATQFGSPVFWVDVGIAFVKGIIQAIPLAIQGFIDGFKNGFNEIFAKIGNDLKELPKKFFDEFRDLFEKFNPVSLLSKLFKLDDGGEGPVEKFLGLNFPFVKFAKGGMVGGNARVSGDSFANDLIPALLSPGEIVLPRSAISGGVGQIFKFLSQLGVDIPGYAFGGKIGKAISGAFGKALDVVSGANSKVINATGTTVRSIFGDNVGDIFDQAFSVLNKSDEFTEIIKSLLKIGAEFDPIRLVRDPNNEIMRALNSVRGFLTEPLRKALVPPGFASGGMIPAGFNNDNFYAGLTSGEFVVNNSLTPKLEEFLTGNPNKSLEEKLDINNALMAKLLTAIQQPVNVSTDIVIGQESIANVILNLNRSNQRLV